MTSALTGNLYTFIKIGQSILRNYTGGFRGILFIGITLLLVLSTNSYSQSPLKISELDKSNAPIGKHTNWFEDKTRNLTFEQIKGAPFTPTEQMVINTGYNSSADWGKFIVHNDTKQTIKRLIRVNEPLLENFDLFYEQGNQLIHEETGILVNKESKNVSGIANYFLVTINPDEQITYYFRLISRHARELEIRVVKPEEMAIYERDHVVLHSLFIGALVIITLYNLFLFFKIKDRSYLYYAMANFGSLSCQLSFSGFLSYYFWPNNPIWNILIIPSCGPMFVAFSALFANEILRLKKYSSWLHYIFYGYMIAAVGGFVPIIINLMGYYVSWAYIITVSLLFSVTTVVLGLISYFKGNKDARFFVVGWAFFLMTVTVFLSQLLGLVPYNFFTANTYIFGSSFEMIFLSFALADRYSRIKKERDAYQKSLAYKEQDLKNMAIENQLKNNYQKEMYDRFEAILQVPENGIKSELKRMMMDMNIQSESDIKNTIFQDNIDKINHEFEAELKSQYEALTPSEIELCKLVHLKKTNKEIAQIRKVSEGAVKVAKHRIKKKTGMDIEALTNQDLMET